MADDASPSSTADGERQRSSLVRALDRVRAAVKRRRESVRNLSSQSPSDNRAPATSHVAVRVAEPDSALDKRPMQDDADTTAPRPLVGGPTEVSPASVAVGDRIGVDTSEDDDQEILLLPVPVNRTRLTPEKAQELFRLHGMRYHPPSPRPSQEPPRKIRRVEKPIRLRVHWTCHECSAQFGIERVCHDCGHQRCRECSRHPPRRVKELVERTQHDIQRDTPSQPQDRSMGQRPHASASTATPVPTTEALETDDAADGDNEDLLRDYDFTMFTRPRAAVHTVLKPKAQIVRRTCHKCNTHILPASRNDCQNCGHVKCGKCQRYPPKASHYGHEVDEAPMVRAVQRVYRKPRQRVRYTCDQCNTPFTDRGHCQTCGHERCDRCHREPSKQSPAQPNAELLQAVTTRLATYHTGLDQPPGVMAGAS